MARQEDSDKLRLEGRASAWVGIALLAAVGAIGAVGLLTAPPAAPPVETPEYIPMEVTLPDATLEQLGTHPDMRVMGIEKDPSAEPLCSEERIARMQKFVLGHGIGEVFVDGASWAGTPDGTRASIASFFSKCLHDGEPIDVLDGPGGAVLAVYASTSGLENRAR